ncbi:MAG: GFA family protein [Gammaproteobacteria bacterium]
MQLEGSCHCGRVRFRLESAAPYPYQRCYCSICRKTAGGGGYAINLGGDAQSLEVEGREHIRVYHARLTDEHGKALESPAERHFCGNCASALWLWAPAWPELIHPFASAIDTPLPKPPERVHMLLNSRANWCEVPDEPRDRHFDAYPEESLADWHRRHGFAD